MLETHASAAQDDDMAHFAWPRGVLLLIGVLIFAGMTAEGVMYDWSVLYLKQEIGMPQARAALGYATFTASMALARFGGDALRARFSEHTLLRCSAAVAAVAMALVLISANAWVAFVGLRARRAPVSRRLRRSCSTPRRACPASAARQRSHPSRRSATAGSLSGRR